MQQLIALIPDYAMPIEGFIGGLMIGTAAAIMLLGLGRIAGVSGLASRAIGLSKGGAPRSIAIAFIIGLPFGAASFSQFNGAVITRFPPSIVPLLMGGLLVGYGTRLGSGCTSGHGVCGISRFSKRSIIATITFMSSGFITIALMRLMGLL